MKYEKQRRKHNFFLFKVYFQIYLMIKKMCQKVVFSFFSLNCILFSFGCSPTPPSQGAPTLPIGPMMECPPSPCTGLSGPKVQITETADANCQYTTTATCTVSGLAQATIQFNGAGPNYAFPQTLTCDTTTGQYSYTDMSSMQQPITSIECICGGNSCGWTTSGGAMTNPPGGVGAPTNPPDSNCIYHLTAFCMDPMNPGKNMIEFGPPPVTTLMTPQPITCPAGYTGFIYTRSDGSSFEIFGADCP